VKERELDPRLPETLARAHEAGLVGSVCLFELRGWEGDHQVVSGELGDWSKLGKSWTPKSCHAHMRATLYADVRGWINGGDETGILGSECRDELPHKVSSVRAEQ
jgi:hypothetical protein